MTRSILALALASFSVVAGAAPPTAQPVSVNVTNTVLPVEVGNADPIPVIQATPTTAREDFRAIVNQLTTQGESVQSYLPVREDSALTGVTVQVAASVTDPATGDCVVLVFLPSADGTPTYLLTQTSAREGQSVMSPFIPLPRIALAAGESIQMIVHNNTGSASCHAVVSVYTQS